MSDPLPTDQARAAQRAEYELTDLGRLPEPVRELAYSWGGTVPGAIAPYMVRPALQEQPADRQKEAVAAIYPASL